MRAGRLTETVFQDQKWLFDGVVQSEGGEDGTGAVHGEKDHELLADRHRAQVDRAIQEIYCARDEENMHKIEAVGDLGEKEQGVGLEHPGPCCVHDRGGAMNISSGRGTLTIRHGTLIDNIASNTAAGVWMRESDATFVIEQPTAKADDD